MARTLYVASTNPGKLRDFSLAAAAARHRRFFPSPASSTIEAPPKMP